MNRILSLLTLFFFSVVVSAADIKLNTRNLPANVVTEAQQKTAKVMDKLLLANDSIRENIQIVITNRYLELREIHLNYDKRNKTIEARGLPKEVEAEAPMAEMYDFSTFVRQATQGRGSMETSFARYEEAPPQVAQKVIEEAKNQMDEA